VTLIGRGGDDERWPSQQLKQFAKRSEAMWRSFFLAIGVSVCLLGVESLAVERAEVKSDLSRSAPTREVVPPDWAPWSLLAGGAVVVLYSFTIPKRNAK
jgi:hypothetical protein